MSFYLDNALNEEENKQLSWGGGKKKCFQMPQVRLLGSDDTFR